MNQHTLKIFLIRFFSVFTVLLFWSYSISYAQIVTNVPENKRNERFLNDAPTIEFRPGLSIAGFSNKGETGYGLKELLNHAYSESKPEIRQLMELTLKRAKAPLMHHPSIDQIENNNLTLQYTAFEALASLILEENGVESDESKDSFGLIVRPHADVMTLFRDAILALARNNRFINKTSDSGDIDDYVKITRSYFMVAKALDLYLGIENAYMHYNRIESHSDLLLSESEKIEVMNRFIRDADILYERGLRRTYGFGFLSVKEDELEPGNRPLKGYLALAFATLATQTSDPPAQERLQSYFQEALHRASTAAGDSDRFKYWMYQTDNGSRYWAEGPYYFDFVLKDAVRFWHAVRLQNSLHDIPDPFRSSWFLEPVRWMADISTPDGAVPPLNDGNKRVIQSSDLLRWSPEFGDASIGELYQRIYSNITQFHQRSQFDDQYYLTEMTIPKYSGSYRELASLRDPQEQQLVLRTTDAESNRYFLFLNGEKGNSILRGEGHQQPDQLQLLYYMNEYSFLVDPGYNSGSPTRNSFRNGYRYNNTMQYNASRTSTSLGFITEQNEGGIPSPYVSVTELRKVSEHNDAVLKTHVSNEALVFISGEVELKLGNSRAMYSRSVIKVKGNLPYVIDLNRAEVIEGRNDFVMRYYGNSEHYLYDNGWLFWEKSGSPFASNLHQLALFTEVVSGSYKSEMDSVEILEYENRGGQNNDKTPYPVKRVSYLSDQDSAIFATMSLLKITDGQLSKPEITAGQNGTHWMVYKPETGTADIVIYKPQETESRDRVIRLPERFGSYIFLPEEEAELFFVRLHQELDEWIINPDYTLNLLPLAAPEITVSASDSLTVELEWVMDTLTGVEGYRLYRGGSVDTLEEIAQLDAQTTRFTDHLEEPVSRLYAIRALYSPPEQSPMSNLVSYHYSALEVSESWALRSQVLSEQSGVEEWDELFGFDRVYHRAEQMQTGRGYWHRSSKPRTQVLYGQGLLEAWVAVEPGWNLIGSIASDLSAQALVDTAGVIGATALWEYEQGAYRQAQVLRPGRGYWLNAQKRGWIGLQADSPAEPKRKMEPEPDAQLVVVSGESRQVFGIAAGELDSSARDYYLAPPLAPQVRLDLRTRGGYTVWDPTDRELVLHADEYPVRLYMQGSETSQKPAAWWLRGTRGGQPVEWALRPGNHVMIEAGVENLRLEPAGKEDAISEFRVSAGYPNPFDRVTKIDYELPKATQVLIEVYDVMGRRVAILVNESQQAGRYSVDFDGSGQASGIYFLQVQALGETSVQKLTRIQ